MQITDNAKEKIAALVEKGRLDPKVLKTAALAGAGGMLGAGLDLYLSGHVDLGDFVKPMGAWGLGGALGALGSAEAENKNIRKNNDNRR